jgi:hypothetical protein
MPIILTLLMLLCLLCRYCSVVVAAVVLVRIIHLPSIISKLILILLAFSRLSASGWCHFVLAVHSTMSLTLCLGRAIAQAVSRRLPTAEARVRAKVRSCGICGGQSGTGAGFLRVLRFPLPVLIPPTAPHSSSSSGAGTRGQLVADVPSGLSLTPKQETKKKKLYSASL